jgi:hypothetical protein
MFILEATEHLHRSVPLLGQGGFFVDEDLINDLLEGTEFRCGTIPS